MKDKRLENFKEFDFNGMRMPCIAVYQHPDDYPECCVARIFDGGQPTENVLIKKELHEIVEDINEHTNMIFVKKGAEDVESLVGVWL